MKRIFLLTALFSISLLKLPADSGDIDALFEDSGSSDGTVNVPEVSPEREPLIDLKNFTFGATFDGTIGYSGGWELEDEPVFSDTAVMLMSSKLTLDARVNEHFRFFQSYSIAFPAFEPKVGEFFADFDLGGRVFFRAGRQNLTWGISRYYKFTNLPARLPEDFGYVRNFNSEGAYELTAIDSDDTIADTDSYSVKIDVPVGIGGFQALMYTRNGFFSDSSNPTFDELGWGGYYNLALSSADLTVGGFYHKDMNLRGFFSGSTTLFSRLELYSEAVVSYDWQHDDLLPLPADAVAAGGFYTAERDPDSLDFCANLGFYIDFFDGKLDFSGEYFYNGEETELDPLGTKLGLPLIRGHNLAAGMGVNFPGGDLRMEIYTLYCASENSGVAAPVIRWNAPGYLELKAAFPFVYGSETGTYVLENPDTKGRRFSFVLTAKVSGRI